jgi:hypothetical protein
MLEDSAGRLEEMGTLDLILRQCVALAFAYQYQMLRTNDLKGEAQRHIFASDPKNEIPEGLSDAEIKQYVKDDETANKRFKRFRERFNRATSERNKLLQAYRMVSATTFPGWLSF